MHKIKIKDDGRDILKKQIRDILKKLHSFSLSKENYILQNAQRENQASFFFFKYAYAECAKSFPTLAYLRSAPKFWNTVKNVFS